MNEIVRVVMRIALTAACLFFMIPILYLLLQAAVEFIDMGIIPEWKEMLGGLI